MSLMICHALKKNSLSTSLPYMFNAKAKDGSGEWCRECCGERRRGRAGEQEGRSYREFFMHAMMTDRYD